MLKRFWEIEELPRTDSVCWSMEERTVINQFKTHYFHSSSGRFVVPLPRKLNKASIGESRSQAVRRFLYLERALSKKVLSDQFNDVMSEYFEMDHAEPIPVTDLNKPPHAHCTERNSPLVDVLLRFHLYRIVLTTDVSRMHRAVELTESDCDFY